MKNDNEYTGRITLNGQQSVKAPITPGGSGKKPKAQKDADKKPQK